MIPVKQTILHDPPNGVHGNCFSAVLASLLHVPIDTVPVFSDPDNWIKDLNRWLCQFGLAYLEIEGLEDVEQSYGIVGLWHETSGGTSRSPDVLHACVGFNGKVVFDPHPSDDGLIGSKVTYGIFLLLEPWRRAEH